MSWQRDHTTSTDLVRELPRPLVRIALAFMIGIVYARFFPVSIPFVLFLVIAGTVLWISLAYAAFSSHARWTLLLILTAGLGMLRMETLTLAHQNRIEEITHLAQVGPQTVTGSVVEHTPQPTTQTTQLILNTVNLEKGRMQTRIAWKLEMIVDTKEAEGILIGDRIQTQAQIVPIHRPHVPLHFDYREYRFSKGIFATSNPVDSSAIHVTGQSAWKPFRGHAYELMRLIDATFPGEANQEMRGLLASMTLGIRTEVPDTLRTALQRSGLAHLTSISGLHVSLVLIVLFHLLKLAGCKRRPAAIITILFSLGYMGLVGARIPTLRAVCMAYVMLGGYFIQRRSSNLNSLGLAALVLLALYPLELFMPSFQLSFYAVLILLLFAPAQRWLHRHVKWTVLRYGLQGFTASFLVTLGLAPFTIYAFHQWSWGAIVGNILAIPVTTFLLPCTYLWFLSTLLPFPWVGHGLAWMVLSLTRSLVTVIDWFGTNPLFHFNLLFPGFTIAALTSFALLLLSNPQMEILQRPYLKIRALHLSLLLVGLAIWLPLLSLGSPSLRIDFVSLGQGDCTVIRHQPNHAILVDAGPYPNPSKKREARLVQYLIAEGIHTIDAIFLSHPQNDHIGCMGEIAAVYPVSHFFESPAITDNKAYATLHKELEKQHTAIHPVTAGDRIRMGEELTFHVLHPDQAALNAEMDINEKSMVLLLDSPDIRMLLTGDIGGGTERQLIKAYPHLDIDIVKVPHHGSQYSSCMEFLQSIHAAFAVISVGKNTYGQPHEETVKRYKQVNAHILRTDQDGTIQLHQRTNKMRIYTTRSNILYIVN
jgi:competence protein ComEC